MWSFFILSSGWFWHIFVRVTRCRLLLLCCGLGIFMCNKTQVWRGCEKRLSWFSELSSRNNFVSDKNFVPNFLSLQWNNSGVKYKLAPPMKRRFDVLSHLQAVLLLKLLISSFMNTAPGWCWQVAHIRVADGFVAVLMVLLERKWLSSWHASVLRCTNLLWDPVCVLWWHLAHRTLYYLGEKWIWMLSLSNARDQICNSNPTSLESYLRIPVGAPDGLSNIIIFQPWTESTPLLLHGCCKWKLMLLSAELVLQSLFLTYG